MKKMLLVVALVAVGVAFGYTQDLLVSDDEIVGYSQDVVGEGTSNEAYVYAKFTLTGIEFQVINLADVNCTGDVGTDNPGNDVWVLTGVTSRDDMAQFDAVADIPFVIENRGALALDLGMYNVIPVGISTGDDWVHAAHDADISYALNQYKLMGSFINGEWVAGSEALVKTEVPIDAAHRIPDAIDWYSFDGTQRFQPSVAANAVFDVRTNLNLPPACGTIDGVDVVDYCQLRLRLAVSEGGSDQYSHAFQIALQSRVTLGE